MKLLFVILVFIVGFVNFSYGEQGNVEQIKIIYAKANKIIKSNNIKLLKLYNESVDIDNTTQWKIVTNGSTINKYNKSNATAIVFINNNTIIKSSININSESGDWKYYVEYIFYNNGCTAFILEKLITYQAFDTDNGINLPKGPYVIEKRYYINEKGKNIKTISKAYNQNNNKAVNEKYIKQIDISLYKSITKLPYYKVLQGLYNKLDTNNMPK